MGSALDTLVREKANRFEFSPVFQALYQFCVSDLSAFYFDIRKDALYCDAPSSTRRRAARTVLDILFDRLVTWFAPILSFTAEEAWQARYGQEAESVHRTLWPETPSEWQDDALKNKWSRIRRLRRVITGALEVDRREKRIGSSLQADFTLYVSNAEDAAAFDGLDLAEIAITSSGQVTLDAAPVSAFRLEEDADCAVVTTGAEGRKCERCWVVHPEVTEHGELCRRCAAAVSTLDQSAA